MVGSRCEISPSARLKPPCVVGSHSRIGDGAVVERSVLLDGCVVEDDAVVSNSILSEGVRVEQGAEVDGAVIGEGELVGAA
jgi:mannose-1-phosphate guanylyltransferase